MILNLEKLQIVALAAYQRLSLQAASDNTVFEHHRETLLVLTAILETYQNVGSGPADDIMQLHKLRQRRLSALETAATHQSQSTFPTPTFENIGCIVYSEADLMFYVSKGFKWVELTILES